MTGQGATVEIDDNETNDQEQPQQQKIDPKEIAAQILSEMRASAPKQQQQQTPSISRLQQAVADLVSKGVPQEGIKHLMLLLEAREQDYADYRRRTDVQAAAQSFENECWASAEESVRTLTDKLSGGDVLVPGLTKAVSDAIKNDDAFAKIKEKIRQAQRPTKADLDKVAEKVFNQYVEKSTPSKKRPLELKSSKPKADQDSWDPEEDLDREERLAYLAIKNALGDDKKARAHIDRIRRIARGG